MAANFSSKVLYFHLGMKCLTKAHWCTRLFQPQWLQITLKRLVYIIALRGKCFVLCQHKQKVVVVGVSSLSPLPCLSVTNVSTYRVQNEFADMHMLYVSAPRRLTLPTGAVWCVFSMQNSSSETREWLCKCRVSSYRKKKQKKTRKHWNGVRMN